VYNFELFSVHEWEQLLWRWGGNKPNLRPRSIAAAWAS